MFEASEWYVRRRSRPPLGRAQRALIRGGAPSPLGAGRRNSTVLPGVSPSPRRAVRDPAVAVAQHGDVPPRSPYDNLVHPRTVKKPVPQVEAEHDLVVGGPELRVRRRGRALREGRRPPRGPLRRRSGATRSGPGFWVEGRPVVLVRPKPKAPAGPARSASGSTYVAGARARVAREGRIYVEGKHDAELVEKVWGHDLRIEGVVVEPLHGVDDLPAIVKRVPSLVGTAARRARRPPGARAPRSRGSPSRSPATTRSSSAIRSSTSGRRSSRPSSASRPGRSCRRGSPGRKASARRWAGRTTPATSGRSGSSPACAPGPTSSPTLIGRVEELIDFVTTD